ncbi:hypothetical protein D9613_010666 [Agrocybe pediades]|uniref:EF-hand domain-containing protein n=1 Tax=Agrocybe pediades TaxID=84607 RepID=A0A8H4VJD0_9AGAR|nr:hypothetical protein D9613_010666 [Agrocybe pediades]
MRSLGRHPTDEELRDILNRIDKDHNGTIDFAEFVDLMGKRELSLVSPALPGGKAAAVDLGITREEEELGELYAAFKEFDKDGSGKINITELGTVMNNLGEKLSEQELQMMIDEADLDGDHEISFSGENPIFCARNTHSTHYAVDGGFNLLHPWSQHIDAGGDVSVGCIAWLPVPRTAGDRSWRSSKGIACTLEWFSRSSRKARLGMCYILTLAARVSKLGWRKQSAIDLFKTQPLAKLQGNIEGTTNSHGSRPVRTIARLWKLERPLQTDTRY